MRMKRVIMGLCCSVMILTNCHNVLGLSTSIELDGGNKESQVVEKEPGIRLTLNRKLIIRCCWILNEGGTS